MARTLVDGRPLAVAAEPQLVRLTGHGVGGRVGREVEAADVECRDLDGAAVGRQVALWLDVDGLGPRRPHGRDDLERGPGLGLRLFSRPPRTSDNRPSRRAQRPKRRGRRACRARPAGERHVSIARDHRDRRRGGSIMGRRARSRRRGPGTRRASGGSGRTRGRARSGSDRLSGFPPTARSSVAGEELLDLLVVLRQPHPPECPAACASRPASGLHRSERDAQLLGDLSLRHPAEYAISSTFRCPWGSVRAPAPNLLAPTRR